MFGISSKKPIVVRNCSTQRTKQFQMERLGSTSECGRYFETVADLDEIRSFCRKNGFYMRETDLKSVVVVDIMNDREVPVSKRPNRELRNKE